MVREVGVQGRLGRSGTLCDQMRGPSGPPLEPESCLVPSLERGSLGAGTGVALVTAQALHAASLVRVTHAAAPAQVPSEVVCALHVHVHVHVQLFYRGGDTRVRACYRASVHLRVSYTPSWLLLSNSFLKKLILFF